ncbi:hypothetical protein ABK040_006009 [Willaertia magna]
MLFGKFRKRSSTVNNNTLTNGTQNGSSASVDELDSSVKVSKLLQSRIQHTVALTTDRTSERYFINTLNTSPNYEIVEELLEIIKTKPHEWTYNFCEGYGLFSLNTFLVKNIMGIFNKTTSRLSLKKAKNTTNTNSLTVPENNHTTHQSLITISKEEDDPYLIISKCLECMKEILTRCVNLDKNPFKDNLDLIKTIGLMLGSTFFKKDDYIIKSILDSQNTILEIFKIILQNDVNGMSFQFILKSMDNVRRVFQEPNRFVHLFSNFRHCVHFYKNNLNTLQQSIDFNNYKNEIELFIFNFINFISLLFDNVLLQSLRNQNTEINNNNNEIRQLSQEFINLGLLESVKVLLNCSNHLSNEMKSAIHQLITHECIAVEEKEQLSKYEHLNHMSSKLFNQLMVNESFDSFCKIYNFLITISNGSEKKQIQENWLNLEKIMSTVIVNNQVIENNNTQNINSAVDIGNSNNNNKKKEEDNALQQQYQEQINTLQSTIKKLEKEIEELKLENQHSLATSTSLSSSRSSRSLSTSQVSLISTTSDSFINNNHNSAITKQRRSMKFDDKELDEISTVDLTTPRTFNEITITMPILNSSPTKSSNLNVNNQKRNSSPSTSNVAIGTNNNNLMVMSNTSSEDDMLDDDDSEQNLSDCKSPPPIPKKPRNRRLSTLVNNVAIPVLSITPTSVTTPTTSSTTSSPSLSSALSFRVNNNNKNNNNNSTTSLIDPNLVRRLYFETIDQHAISRTLFHHIHNNNNSSQKKKINEEELLYYFSGRQVPLKSRMTLMDLTEEDEYNKSIMESDNGANVSFLSNKRIKYILNQLMESSTIGILNNVDTDLKQAILTFDRTKIDDKVLNILIKISPKQEEIDMIKTFEGDVESLHRIDKFFYQLRDIPFLKERLECWKFKLEYSNELNNLLRDIDTCRLAAKEIISSKKWKELLLIILNIGNLLNKNSNYYCSINEEEMCCKGFKLSSLLKLKDIKSYNNKFTLIEYLSDYLNQNYPELMTFDVDLLNVPLATQIKTIQIREKLYQFQQNLHLIQHQLLIFKYKPSIRDKFVSEFSQFKEQLSSDLDDNLNNKIELMLDQLEHLARLYDEDIEMIKLHPNQFFTVVNQFINMFKNPSTVKQLIDEEFSIEENENSTNDATNNNNRLSTTSTNSGRSSPRMSADDLSQMINIDTTIAYNIKKKLKGTSSLKEPTSARMIKSLKSLNLGVSVSEVAMQDLMPPQIHTNHSSTFRATESSLPTSNSSKSNSSSNGKLMVTTSKRRPSFSMLFSFETKQSVDNNSTNNKSPTTPSDNNDNNSSNNKNETQEEEDDKTTKTEQACEVIYTIYGVNRKELCKAEDLELIYGPGTIYLYYQERKIEYRAFVFNYLFFIGRLNTATVISSSLINMSNNLEEDVTFDTPPPLYKIISFEDLTIRAIPNTSTLQNAFSLQSFKGDVGDIFIAKDKFVRQIWIDKIQKILDPPFFSEQWTKKINDNIQSYLDKTDEDPQSYYTQPLDNLDDFDNFNDEDSIEYRGSTQEIAYASKDKLLLHLTDPIEHDNNFLYTFMLTYKSFISTDEVLEYLIKRYNTKPPKESDFNTWKQHLFAIRLRICQILMYWIERHFYNFRNDSKVQKRMDYFIKEVIAKTKMEKAAERISSAWEIRKQQRETFSMQQIQRQQIQMEFLRKQIAESDGKDPLSPMSGSVSPSSAFGNNNTLNTGNGEKTSGSTVRPRKASTFQKLFKFYDDNNNAVTSNDDPLEETATEIARQLTMVDMEIYSRIQPKECLNQAWNKKNQRQQAPNIFSMIQRTNNLVTFVSYHILKHENVKDRAKMIQKFIKIATELKNLNNFNSLKGIIGGLNSNAIHRLKKTWAIIPDSKLQEFKELCALMSHTSNHKNLRDLLQSVEPPSIPYIGLFLTDLVFIEDGNPDQRDDKINFVKRRHLATVIRTIQKFQKTPYNFPYHPIRSKLTNVYFDMDDGQLYDMSIEREPRQQQQ